MKRTLFATAVLVVVSAMQLAAHHSFASEYDENKHVTVLGTVTDFQWINPHAFLLVDGTEESGKTESGSTASWKFEMGSPNGLESRGWKKGDLKKGDRITIEGFGAKDAANVANATTVTLPDGRKLFGGFQTTPGAPVKK